ncbi:beta-ketoacyl synthase domain-containing protein [Thozetella sp. PMI_491]|nr:beta-ketoacyl synthase domain-containing protein [Thozetella sp. PMI_491]
MPGQSFEPIAIIGMGMRLPGSVHDASSYWDLLVNGKSGLCPVPKSRYNVDAWYGPERVSHVSSKVGYFLDDVNLAHVDSSFWSFGKQEAELMDPQQRLFLEVVYEAFESAGETDWRGKEIGVYVGAMGDDWKELKLRDDQHLQPIRADVFGDYIIANRTSYEFDLKGPSLVTRTACSSSLVALHMACQDLHSRNCVAAVVGGVNLIQSPGSTATMTEQGVLSPTGSCKSFDADADGYTRGEGISAIYIKRLSNAIRDGDPIRAVIRSTCLGSDGKTAGMTAPDPKSHERLMRMGHRIAGIEDLSKTAMVECHGTGTVVGDPLEAQAVASVWGQHGIYIGSVKPNIGHGEGASGISSVIKMVLALENSTIPPNINFKTPNPRIPWNEAKLTVLLESASCFGVPSVPQSGLIPPEMAPEPRLLFFSATHTNTLQKVARNTESYLAKAPGRFSDLAYTLGARRKVHSHRAFSIVDGQTPFELSSTSKPAPVPESMVWVFTGQGAQWAQMGKELYEHHPLVRQRIDGLESILAMLPDPPSWSLTSELLAPKSKSRLYEAEFSQPCLAAIQISLVDLLHSWNITPAAVVGHSSGETAAAYASGAITAEEAFLLAYYRGQITPYLKAAHSGGMAAVGLGRTRVQKHLQPGVIIGCENSPLSVTLSGEKEVLKSVMEQIKAQYPDVFVRALHVECGYHSHHMQAVKPNYEARLAGKIHARRPTVPFYSSVTGTVHHDLSSDYWARNLVSPVLFDTAVRAVLADIPSPIFVEIGPHAALAGPLRQTVQAEGKTAPYIPTLVRGEDGLVCVLKTAGQLWLAGHSIEIGLVNPKGQLLTDLPTYPWHYDAEYWAESRISSAWRFKKFDHHELLGTRILESSDSDPVWRCRLRVSDVPWLRDHVVDGDTVFPWSGYISMVGEAMRQLSGSVGYSARKVNFLEALVLNDEPIELVTTLSPKETIGSDGKSVWYDFSISTLRGETWTRNVSGQCRGDHQFEMPLPIIQALPRKASSDSFYDTWRRYGLSYGAAFRGLSSISSHVTEKKATGTAVESCERTSSYSIHPTALDSSVHLCMVADCYGLERNFNTTSAPRYIEAMQVEGVDGPIQVIAEASKHPNRGTSSNITGVSNGKVAFQIKSLEVSPLSSSFPPVDYDPHAGATLEWKPDVDFINATHLQHSSEFLDLLGNKKPSLHVLEVGSDTKDISSFTLQSLVSARGERTYSKYVYTRSSPDDLATARSQLKGFQDVTYTILDPSNDLVSQGLKEKSFDLVAFSGHIAKPKDAVPMLTNLGRLLQPSGRLLIYRDAPLTNGTHSFQEDFIEEGHLVRLQEKEIWRTSLSEAGFNGADAIFLERDGGAIITRLATRLAAVTKVNVLCRDSLHPVVSEATDLLTARGFNLEFFIIGQELPQTGPTLCLLDLEGAYLYSMQASEYAAFKQSLLSVQDGGMLWVTGASQIDCKDPNFSLILGAARTLRRENSIDLVTMELEHFDKNGWAATADMLATFANRKLSREMDRDSEYVLHNGLVKIGRFHKVKISEMLLGERNQNASREVAVERPGAIQLLHWVETNQSPLTGNCVNIDVRAMQMCSEDIARVIRHPSQGKQRPGLAGTGIVCDVGPHVHDLRIGDRVAFNVRAPLSTLVTVPETACIIIPEALTFVQAVTIPTSYGAAIYAFEEVVKLREGYSVLVDGGCSPKSVAAIQLAKLARAEIYCVARNEDEVKYFASVLEVPQHHILSGTGDFLSGSLLDATNGQGVDVVLYCPPARDELRTYWECVGPLGTLVQIGKRHPDDKATLDCDFGCNRWFANIDFDELCFQRPIIWKSLVSRAFELYVRGLVRLIRPVTIFDASEAFDAFRNLHNSKRNDDAVVVMPDNPGNLTAQPAPRETRLRPDRAYLLVGGLGGLGQSTARFLVEKGARHLIFFSRSADNGIDSNHDLVHELALQDCTVQIIRGDVGAIDDVRRMISSSKVPIAGVFHAAAVLRDQTFTQMNFSQWHDVITTKVHGAWNLHYALQDQPEPLDFFFLFSSLSGLCGLVGQANYAAANTFLDAFVQYRHSLGLPCSALDIGAVHGIGILAREPHRLDALRAETLHALRERDVLEALEVMIGPYRPKMEDERDELQGYVSHGQIAIGFSAKGPGITSWKKDSRGLFFEAAEGANHEEAKTPENATLKEFLASCVVSPLVLERKETVAFLAREIGAALFGFLMRGVDEVDYNAPLRDIGVDSLVSVELRHWFRQKFGVMLTILEILNAESLMDLGERMRQRLVQRYKSGRSVSLL